MVNVLIATTEFHEMALDGDDPGPTGRAVEGELLYVPVGPAGQGGDRFKGMASHRWSPTALVVRRSDLSLVDLWTGLTDSLVRQRTLGDDRPERWSDEETERFRHLFQRMLATASYFPVGSILERRGERIHRVGGVDPLSIPSDSIGREG